MKNNYDHLVEDYRKSHAKPDKLYSMLPTVLSLNEGGKYIVDVGCGDGFFTRKLAQSAETVVGIDNSFEQIKRAKEDYTEHVIFEHIDMMDFNYSDADVVNAPYVINYLETRQQVVVFFTKIFQELKTNGRFVGVMDMPQSTYHNMRQFGSIKSLATLCDEQEITIELFNNDELLLTLKSIFYTKETITKLLKAVGFSKIQWYRPLVSEEGLLTYGDKYWKEYLENCDVAYFSATK